MERAASTRGRATLYAILFGAIGLGLGAIATALLSREIPGGSGRTAGSNQKAGDTIVIPRTGGK